MERRPCGEAEGAVILEEAVWEVVVRIRVGGVFLQCPFTFPRLEGDPVVTRRGVRARGNVLDRMVSYLSMRNYERDEVTPRVQVIQRALMRERDPLYWCGVVMDSPKKLLFRWAVVVGVRLPRRKRLPAPRVGRYPYL